MNATGTLQHEGQWEVLSDLSLPFSQMNATAARDAAPSTRTEADKVLDSQRRLISDGTENDRNLVHPPLTRPISAPPRTLSLSFTLGRPTPLGPP